MADALKRPEPSLYERDFYAWTQDQAAKLRARAHNSIDWDNTAEEIESVGRSEKRELESRLEVLLLHLLKWMFQSERQSRSWRNTIVEQRSKIQRELKASPSLRTYPADVLGEDYPLIRSKAADETGLPEDAFPAECPFTIDQILDPDFYPEAPE